MLTTNAPATGSLSVTVTGLSFASYTASPRSRLPAATAAETTSWLSDSSVVSAAAASAARGSHALGVTAGQGPGASVTQV